MLRGASLVNCDLPWEPLKLDYPRIYMYIHRMTTTTSKTFRSGNSEAIRLPKEVAFGENVELVLVRSGDVVTLYPAKMTLADMEARLAKMPAPPNIETRDSDEIPERRRL